MRVRILFLLVLFLAISLSSFSQLEVNHVKKVHKPLDSILVQSNQKGTVKIKDGKGNIYFQQETPAEFTFNTAGALGFHTINFYNSEGEEVQVVPFRVDCESGIEDSSGKWGRLFTWFKFNQLRSIRTEKYNHEIVQMHEICPRNDANAVRGTQYIYDRIRDGVELFGELQNDDGMIYDLYRWTDKTNTSTLDGRSNDPDHFVVIEDGWYYKQRFPVENDLEHFYVQWLWRVWKATGDTEWMKEWLPHAVKALEYSRTNPLRWSDKYQLLKRGFTIDTWDFQPDHEGYRGDHMDIHADVTDFGIMHGDNTGYAYSCNLLSEMLNAIGKKQDAKNWKILGDEVFKRLTDLSWNGEYFYHFIPEDSSHQRDLGVDQSKQVSLSNALALQRNIPDEMAQDILKTYQRIRKEMPESSPGEYFGIYPPIEKGYSVMPYHYINGGVFAFIAGDLAIGAFDHGFEEYGADIMSNMYNLMEEQFGQLPYFWIGKKESRPPTDFEQLDISELANVEVLDVNYRNENSWTGPGQEYALNVLPNDYLNIDDIPFNLIDFKANNNKGYIGIGTRGSYASKVIVPVNRNAKSLYILHTLNGGGLAGWMTINYKDGTSVRKYVQSGSEVNGWYFPKNVPYSRTTGWTCKMAWRGKNGFVDVGVHAWGLDNPHPEKKISNLTFTDSGLGKQWLIFGITLSDQPKFFNTPDITRYYVNTGWNAGTFLSTIIEGLAGIKNDGLAYSEATVSPKWLFAGEKDVAATAKLPASGEYVRYSYKNISDNSITLEVTSSGEKVEVEIPLPENKRSQSVTVNGKKTDYNVEDRFGKYYATLQVNGKLYHQIEVTFQ